MFFSPLQCVQLRMLKLVQLEREREEGGTWKSEIVERGEVVECGERGRGVVGLE